LVLPILDGEDEMFRAEEVHMSVLVQMRVSAPDVDQFVAAHNRFAPLFAEMGAKDRRVFRSESDPNEVTMMADWESHEAMHAASEKYGDDFNKEAGTDGREWETRIWHELA
jgi:quinol monooxygenase YgiN